MQEGTWVQAQQVKSKFKQRLQHTPGESAEHFKNKGPNSVFRSMPATPHVQQAWMRIKVSAGIISDS